MMGVERSDGHHVQHHHHGVHCQQNDWMLGMDVQVYYVCALQRHHVGAQQVVVGMGLLWMGAQCRWCDLDVL